MRKRKPKSQKRAERIHRRATTLEIEEIIEWNISEKAALSIHKQRVKEWFRGQNDVKL